MSKIDHRLFSNSEANAAAYGACPKCGSELTIKFKGKSSFIGCTAYPTCTYTRTVVANEVTTLKTIDDSQCPSCGSLLAVKKGKYGFFIGCTNFPTCHFISTNQSPKKESEYTPVKCPICDSGNIEKKQNRYGKFFFACDQYPKCNFTLKEQPLDVLCEKCGSRCMTLDKKTDRFLCANPGCGHQQSRQI